MILDIKYIYTGILLMKEKIGEHQTINYLDRLCNVNDFINMLEDKGIITNTIKSFLYNDFIENRGNVFNIVKILNNLNKNMEFDLYSYLISIYISESKCYSSCFNNKLENLKIEIDTLLDLDKELVLFKRTAIDNMEYNTLDNILNNAIGMDDIDFYRKAIKEIAKILNIEIY